MILLKKNFLLFLYIDVFFVERNQSSGIEEKKKGGCGDV